MMYNDNDNNNFIQFCKKQTKQQQQQQQQKHTHTHISNKLNLLIQTTSKNVSCSWEEGVSTPAEKGMSYRLAVTLWP